MSKNIVEENLQVARQNRSAVEQVVMTTNKIAQDDGRHDDHAISHEERVALVVVKMSALITESDFQTGNADIIKSNVLKLTESAERLFQTLSHADSEEVVVAILNNQSGTVTKTMQQSRKRLLVKAFAMANAGYEMDIAYSKKSGYFAHTILIPVLSDRDKAYKALENAMETALGKLSRHDIQLIVDVALKGIDALI